MQPSETCMILSVLSAVTCTHFFSSIFTCDFRLAYMKWDSLWYLHAQMQLNGNNVTSFEYVMHVSSRANSLFHVFD